MELTSIYGEMFNGEIVAEHENIVIAEDKDGVRYTVHKSKIGKYKPETKWRYHAERFDVEGTMMRAVMPSQKDRTFSRYKGLY